MTFRGLSPKLQSAQDLLGKLERDFERIKGDPHDADAAFDFFVTAEHLGEWLPGKNPLAHDGGHGGSGLLEVVCHLANGAKHFEATSPRHQSVRDVTDRGGAFQSNAFQANAFDVGGLAVEHNGFDARAPGKIDVLTLASDVLAFWKARI